MTPDSDATEQSSMHPSTEQRIAAAELGFSLDWWSVIIAILLALLVLAGIIPSVPW